MIVIQKELIGLPWNGLYIFHISKGLLCKLADFEFRLWYIHAYDIHWPSLGRLKHLKFKIQIQETVNSCLATTATNLNKIPSIFRQFPINTILL